MICIVGIDIDICIIIIIVIGGGSCGDIYSLIFATRTYISFT